MVRPEHRAPAKDTPSDELFFGGVRQSELTLGDLTLKSPGVYRDAALMMAIFTADRRAAAALLPSPRLRPLAPLPGRALVAVNCFEYRDSEVGPYNELGISVGVTLDGGALPDLVNVAGAALNDSYGGHVVQLPVNTEISQRVGREVFNYPKYLGAIDFVDEGARLACHVSDASSGEPIYSLAIDKPKTRPPRRVARRRQDLETITFSSYLIKEERLHQARFVINPLERGQSILRAKASFELGAHPRARALAPLRIGRPLRVIYAPRARALLYEPIPI